MGEESIRPSRQLENAPPVIEDAKMPMMGDRTRRPRRIGGKIRKMADEPKADAGRRNRMSPVPRVGSRRATRRGKVPDQEPKPAGRGSRDSRESYVRLRLRVEGQEMSVVGIREVEGPLVQPDRVHGGLTYEASVGDRRVAVGSIADAGLARSFPDPRHPERGHFVTELPSYDVSVRVPRAEISRSSIGRLQVALYRAKELTGQPIGTARIAEQYPRELREIARLKGLRPEALPASLRKDLDRILS